MDIIQQVMLVLVELLEKVRMIFSFINSQFLPSADGENGKETII